MSVTLADHISNVPEPHQYSLLVNGSPELTTAKEEAIRVLSVRVELIRGLLLRSLLKNDPPQTMHAMNLSVGVPEERLLNIGSQPLLPSALTFSGF